jgi:hypothetical protein
MFIIEIKSNYKVFSGGGDSRGKDFGGNLGGRIFFGCNFRRFRYYIRTRYIDTDTRSKSKILCQLKNIRIACRDCIKAIALYSLQFFGFSLQRACTALTPGFEGSSAVEYQSLTSRR